MAKKYTLHLDALIIIAVLFLASLLANIFILKANNNTGEQLLGVQSELVLSQLNLQTRNEELALCQNNSVSSMQ